MDIDEKSRLDGVILIVVSGVIQDAVFIEVKNDTDIIEEEQIIKYYKLAQDLSNVPKILTISNEFVADSSHSPVTISNQSKKISLYHFSWTYLKTLAQLLLFNNDNNIEDDDQVEIMKEVIHYLNDTRSGVSSFSKMSGEWFVVAENIKYQKDITEKELIKAITSWYQEESNMTLMLSRELGVLVKLDVENPKTKLIKDIKKLKTEYYLSTKLKVKGAASEIRVTADFQRRTISMSVNITPPLDGGVTSRITWLKKQLEKMKDQSFLEHLYIEADIKFTKQSIKLKYSDIDKFYEHKNKDIIGFNLDVIKSSDFRVTKFVTEIEGMLKTYYQVIVQDLKTWEKPAPKLQPKKEIKAEDNS
jgi:hypothetical protein